MPKIFARILSSVLVLCLIADNVSAFPIKRTPITIPPVQRNALFQEEALVSMATGAAKYIFSAARTRNAALQHEISPSPDHLKNQTVRFRSLVRWAMIPVIGSILIVGGRLLLSNWHGSWNWAYLTIAPFLMALFPDPQHVKQGYRWKSRRPGGQQYEAAELYGPDGVKIVRRALKIPDWDSAWPQGVYDYVEDGQEEAYKRYKILHPNDPEVDFVEMPVKPKDQSEVPQEYRWVHVKSEGQTHIEDLYDPLGQKLARRTTRIPDSDSAWPIERKVKIVKGREADYRFYVELHGEESDPSNEEESNGDDTHNALVIIPAIPASPLLIISIFLTVGLLNGTRWHQSLHGSGFKKVLYRFIGNFPNLYSLGKALTSRIFSEASKSVQTRSIAASLGAA